MVRGLGGDALAAVGRSLGGGVKAGAIAGGAVGVESRATMLPSGHHYRFNSEALFFGADVKAFRLGIGRQPCQQPTGAPAANAPESSGQVTPQVHDLERAQRAPGGEADCHHPLRTPRTVHMEAGGARTAGGFGAPRSPRLLQHVRAVRL